MLNISSHIPRSHQRVNPDNASNNLRSAALFSRMYYLDIPIKFPGIDFKTHPAPQAPGIHFYPVIYFDGLFGGGGLYN